MQCSSMQSTSLLSCMPEFVQLNCLCISCLRAMSLLMRGHVAPKGSLRNYEGSAGQQTANLQEMFDDLVWDDVAHIVCIGQLREGNSSHLSLLQVCKSWPSTVACRVSLCFEQTPQQLIAAGEAENTAGSCRTLMYVRMSRHLQPELVRSNMIADQALSAATSSRKDTNMCGLLNIA